MLRQIKADPNIYKEMEEKAQRLAAGLRQAFPQFTVNQVGSLLCLFFTNEPVKDFGSAKKSDTALYGRYFNHMLEAGIYLAPAQFEAMFISACHTDEDIEKTIEAAGDFAKNLPL